MLLIQPNPSLPTSEDEEERSWLRFVAKEARRDTAPQGLQPDAWKAFLSAEARAAAPAVVKEASRSDWERYLAGLTATLGPDVVDVLRDGVEALRAAVDSSSLREAIGSGIPLSIEAAIPWAKLTNFLANGSRSSPALRLTLERAASEAVLQVASDLEEQLAATLSRDALYGKASRYATTRGSALVTGLTESTRAGVRAVVAEAFDQGRSVLDTGKALEAILGLDARRAVAFDRYIQTLMDSDLSAGKIQQRMDQRYGKLLRQRGQTVARTELWTAGNVGQLEAWKEAAAEGLMDIRGLAKYFTSDLGEMAYHPGIHPHCYCSVRLVRVTVHGVSYYVREWVIAPRNPCRRCLAFKGKRAS